MKYVVYVLQFLLRNAVAASLLVVLAGTGAALKKLSWEPMRLLRGVLVILSMFWIVVLLILFVNHIRFPLFLDLMEGVVFQHVERLASLQPVYAEPTPEYVPLAYNVGYYVVAVPFTWVFGLGLPTLRLISVLATLGIGTLVFFVLRRVTSSARWALFGCGLFAAYYAVMDAYLDTAHSDSCFILCALAATALLDRSRAQGVRLLAITLLVAAFWFKQHGALFLAGGLVFVTIDEGWRRSWPYWLISMILGPFAYVVVGPLLFGPEFHYFTYHVPAAWSELRLWGLLRLVAFFGLHYVWLMVSAAYWFVSHGRNRWRSPSAWHVQFTAAVATAGLGSLDPGSSNNVYIPLGVWLVTTAVWGLWMMEQKSSGRMWDFVPSAMLFLSFALAAYDPRAVMRTDNVDRAYSDFIAFLHSVDGTVYAPTLGQLPHDYTFYPAAHWVALEDLIRGPGRDTHDSPVVQGILAPLLDESEPRYVLENYPLTHFSFYRYLNDHFVLVEDFGTRFKPLEVLPSTFSHGWPRYLYRLDHASFEGGERTAAEPDRR